MQVTSAVQDEVLWRHGNCLRGPMPPLHSGSRPAPQSDPRHLPSDARSRRAARVLAQRQVPLTNQPVSLSPSTPKHNPAGSPETPRLQPSLSLSPWEPPLPSIPVQPRVHHVVRRAGG